MDKKIKISLFTIFFILSGFYLGLNFNFLKAKILNQNEIKKEIKENNIDNKIDLSLIKKVKKILDEKFIDTREDKTKKITEKDKIYGAVQGYVSAYDDPYTVFFPPVESKQFKDEISGKFYGVGMRVGYRDGYLTVVNTLPDTPAEKAGLKSKDIIYKIDDKESLNMSIDEAVSLIKGKKGTKVKLTILRKGLKKPLEVEIVRDEITIPIGKTYFKDGVFVIKFYSFSGETSKWFLEKILKDFRKAKTDKLIIDLRNNPGGLMNSAIFIAGLFLKDGDKIIEEDFQGNGKNRIYRAGDYSILDRKVVNIFKNLKLGILTNEGSASASEILSGSLVDNKKAILFGEKTYGKGVVQETVPMEDGAFLKVTVAKYILPNGEWISYKGIKPDVEIKISDEEFKKMVENDNDDRKKYIDAQLMKVIKYMSKIKNQKEFNQKIDEFAKKRIEEKKNEKEDGKDILKKINSK